MLYKIPRYIALYNPHCVLDLHLSDIHPEDSPEHGDIMNACLRDVRSKPIIIDNMPDYVVPRVLVTLLQKPEVCTVRVPVDNQTHIFNSNIYTYPSVACPSKSSL